MRRESLIRRGARIYVRREVECNEQTRSYRRLIDQRSDTQQENHDEMRRQLSELSTKFSDSALCTNSRGSLHEWRKSSTLEYDCNDSNDTNI